MAILAFDTCFGACSAALRWRHDGGVDRVVSRVELMVKGHSERLVPMIAEVLAEAGLGFADLSRIAVTLGPGSFTGVRTGISVARALGLATGLDVVGTTSLHAMAVETAQTYADRTIVVAVATRGGLLYCQVFHAQTTKPMMPPWLATPESAAAAMAGSAAVVVASGADLVVAAALSLGIDAEVDPTVLQPNAAHLARIADHLPKLVAPQPIYLRDADARPQAGLSLARAP